MKIGVSNILSGSLCVLSVFMNAGCLSDGKFYRVSAAPTLSDTGRGSGQYTDGTKLTDEYSVGATWNPATELVAFVGWANANNTLPTVDITVDLGAAYPLTIFGLHAGAGLNGVAKYPAFVDVYPSNTASGTAFARLTFPSSPTTTHESSLQYVQVPAGQPVTSRYVTFRVGLTSNAWAIVDQIYVEGAGVAQVKFPPQAGGNPGNKVYHGAINPGANGPNPVGFEQATGKNLAAYLNYNNWSHGWDVPSPMGNPSAKSVYDSLPRETMGLQVAWEIQGVNMCGSDDDDCVTCMAGTSKPCALDRILSDINANNPVWDNYLRDYFVKVRDDGRPLFLRVGAEMNGDWSAASGARNGGNIDSTKKFKAVWRRIYNIAQQVGATNVAFVWSPNFTSQPNVDWNNFKNYYPGVQYVDWVGIDGPYNFPAQGDTPRNYIQPFYDEYAPSRPMMLAEHASCPTSTGPVGTKAAYINSLYPELGQFFPKIWATFWFNLDKECDWRIQAGDGSLAAYQTRVRDNARYVSAMNVVP